MIKKTFYLAMMLIAYNTHTTAQNVFSCDLTANPNPPPATIGFNSCGSSIDYITDAVYPERRPVLKVRVNFHFMLKSDGTGNFTATSTNTTHQSTYITNGYDYVNDLLYNVNLNLQNNQKAACPAENTIPNLPIQLEFELFKDKNDPDDKGVYFHSVPDVDYYYEVNHVSALKAKYSKKGSAVMDIFFVANKKDEKTNGGSSVFYGDCFQILDVWRAYRDDAGLAGWNFSPTICHEFGHSVGLTHTFNGQANCSDADYPKTSTPPCNNWMTYEASKTSLTPCQLGLVHEYLTNSLPDYINKDDLYTFNSARTVIINSGENIVWNSNRYLQGNIVLKSGSKLTLNCSLNMAQGAKIIIEPGAILDVENGTITNNHGELWQGIEVMGNANEGQQVSGTSGAQGKLILNNATIEYAYNAVSTARHYDWGIDVATTGGIVEATTSKFYNCKRAVEFLKYRNRTSATESNVSYFSRCEFTVDDNFPLEIDPDQAMFTMWDVKDVSISGSIFQDLRTTLTSPSDALTGISTLDAGFKVNPYSTSGQSNYVPSTFTNLDCAISMEKTASSKPTTIDNITFQSCGVGVLNKGMDNTRITRNIFRLGHLNIPSNSTGIASIGVGFSTGTMYKLEENQFGSQINANNPTWGIVLNNTGPIDNSTYLNKFTTDMGEVAIRNNRSTQASQQSGQFTGLQFLCNTHNTTRNDIIIHDDAGFSDDGVRQYQGRLNQATIDPTSAGNLFTNNSLSSETDIFNRSDLSIVYLFDVDTKEEPLYYTRSKVTPSKTTNSNQCLSKLIPKNVVIGGGTTPTPPRDIDGINKTIDKYLKTYSPVYEQYKLVYNRLLDGGNTGLLVQNTNSAKPSQSAALKQQLSLNKPWLSASVLQAVINRPDIFTNAEVYKILQDNPDALHYENIFESVANKANPLTGTQIDNLRQMVSSAKTDRSNVEQALALYGWEKNRAAIEIAQSYLTDESKGPDYANYRYWLAKLESAASQYLIVDSYIEQGNYSTALSVLNKIPTQFTLSDEEKRDYQETLTFLQIITDLHNKGKLLNQLSTAQKESITTLAEKGIGQGGQRARNLLCWWYGTHCEPNWTLPTITNSSARGAEKLDEQKRQVVDGALNLFPNPATNQLMITYKFDEVMDNLVEIQVYDMLGRMVYQQNANSSESNLSLNIENWAQGMYEVRIAHSGKQLATQRLLVQRLF